MEGRNRKHEVYQLIDHEVSNQKIYIDLQKAQRKFYSDLQKLPFFKHSK